MRPSTTGLEPSSHGVVPLPLPIDDECLSTSVSIEGVQPRAQLSKLEFFRDFLQLFNIMVDVVSLLYTPMAKPKVALSSREGTISDRNADAAAQQVMTVVDLESRLEAFWSSVPLGLKSCASPAQTPDSNHNIFKRQSTVLRCR